MYVAGSMRSGTTWLGVLIAERAGLLCVGELSGVPRQLIHHDQCACHRHVLQCAVWGAALRDELDSATNQTETTSTVERLEQALRTKHLLVNELRYRWRRPARWANDIDLLRRLLDRALLDSGLQGFVDTSKRMGILQFHVRSGTDMKVVHIIRNPWDVAVSDKCTSSSTRGTSTLPPGQSPIRSALRWSWTNLFTSSYVTLSRLPHEVVFYEELRDSTNVTLVRIFDAIGLTSTEATGSNHAAVGNPTRLLDSEPQAQRPAGAALTRTEAWAVGLITAPARLWIARRHGIVYAPPPGRHVAAARLPHVLSPRSRPVDAAKPHRSATRWSA